ncbi:hypothetical protein K2173_007508 [Erythroxylum novogranatense]|uniref:Uncharacterized protein n=1 Tax=Erythroxylum novogranatense TaxID=1862640 RepID=A0AAV8T7W3_9ROSI|nr:hypothetical protein K2173_007508 [Erythroxylum novogranatense]
MADQRPFRFRLPWLSVASAPRPAAEPRPPRPAVEPQPPRPESQPTRPAVEPPRPTPESQPTRPQPLRPATEPPHPATTFQPPRPVAEPQPPRLTTESQPTRPAAEPQPPHPTTESQPTQPAAEPQPLRPATESRPTRPTAEPPRPTATFQPPRPVAEPLPPRLTTESQPTRPATEPQPPHPTTESQPTRPAVERQPPRPRTESQLIGPAAEPQPPRPAAEPQPLRPTAEPQPPRPIAEVRAPSERPPFGPQRDQAQPSATALPRSPTRPALQPQTTAVTDSKPESPQQQVGKTTESSSPSRTGKEVRPQPKTGITSGEISQSEKQAESIKITTTSFTRPKAWNGLTESHQRHAISNREAPLHKGIREDIAKFVHKLRIGQTKLSLDQKPVSIVTLAGENRGAFMRLGSEQERKDGSIHIKRGYKINQDESTTVPTDGEGISKKQYKDQLSNEDQARKAFINSNTQGINNSIVSQTEIHESNPGIRLVLNHNLAEITKYSTKPELLETLKAEHKAEHTTTSAEKLNYEPTVSQRCLQGLLLESSNSDPDNPEKPRQHGCRYKYGEKGKDKDIGII